MKEEDVWVMKKYGSARKYRLNKKFLRAAWALFWLSIPIPVITAGIAGFAKKVFKKDILVIRRFN